MQTGTQLAGYKVMLFEGDQGLAVQQIYQCVDRLTNQLNQLSSVKPALPRNATVPGVVQRAFARN